MSTLNFTTVSNFLGPQYSAFSDQVNIVIAAFPEFGSVFEGDEVTIFVPLNAACE